MMDFRDYRTAARFALQINEGYSAGLVGIGPNPYPEGSDEAQAWDYGNGKADRDVTGSEQA